MLPKFTQIQKRGFTLIELLVVISIIGLLSSIVMASLKSARDKAADAAVKQNLAQIHAQAEIFYQANNTYGGLDAASTLAYSVYSAALRAVGGVNGTQGGFYADASSNTWVTWVILKTNISRAWCVDYTGVSTVIITPSPPGTHVPPYDCATIGTA